METEIERSRNRDREKVNQKQRLQESGNYGDRRMKGPCGQQRLQLVNQLVLNRSMHVYIEGFLLKCP